MKPTIYHIPVCPFSQRLEILLELKGCRDQVDFSVVDITRPRDPELLALTRGTTALPVLRLPDDRIIKESLVILDFLDESLPGPRIAQADPYRRAVERMLGRMEGDFANRGYGWVMNRDPARREEMRTAMLQQYARLSAFLDEHAQDRTFLFEDFGWAEAVMTPFFMRFWFLEYYEDFALPDEAAYARVRKWVDACLAHPAAQQVCREEIVKLYYDYTQGAGNGALPAGRNRSSFSFLPHWRDRPWPPADKYTTSASDHALGL
jgi:glutathione S-transferase